MDAYLARRVLDHLLGMELSQLLWRKLPGATSAGARPWLRLCCWLGAGSGTGVERGLERNSRGYTEALGCIKSIACHGFVD